MDVSSGQSSRAYPGFTCRSVWSWKLSTVVRRTWCNALQRRSSTHDVQRVKRSTEQHFHVKMRQIFPGLRAPPRTQTAISGPCLMALALLNCHDQRVDPLSVICFRQLNYAITDSYGHQRPV